MFLCFVSFFNFTFFCLLKNFQYLGGPKLDEQPSNVLQMVNGIPRYAPPHGVTAPDMLRRPLGPQGRFGPLPPRPIFNSLAYSFQHAHPNILVGGPGQKRPPPLPMVFSSSHQTIEPSIPFLAMSNVCDESELHGESKKSRLGSPIDTLGSSLEKKGGRLDQLCGNGQQTDGGPEGVTTNTQGANNFSPEVESGVISQGHPEHDCIWHGVIAKSNIFVCRARCIPVKIEFGAKM